jgi:hypothetical protein
LSQKFHYVSPQVFMKIPNIYADSFHGSCLWDNFSPNCERLYLGISGDSKGISRNCVITPKPV